MLVAANVGSVPDRYSAPWTLFVAAVVISLGTLQVAAVSAFAAAVARRTVHALLMSYGILAFLYLALPLFIMVSGANEDALRLVAAVHPFVTLALSVYDGVSLRIPQLLGFVVCTSGMIVVFRGMAFAPVLWGSRDTR